MLVVEGEGEKEKDPRNGSRRACVRRFEIRVRRDMVSVVSMVWYPWRGMA